MITVQAYRTVIGLFYGKARCIQQQNLDHGRGGSNWETDFVGRKRGNCNTSRNPCLDMLYFARTFLLIFIGIVLYCNVNLAFVKLLRLITKAWSKTKRVSASRLFVSCLWVCCLAGGLIWSLAFLL